MIPQHWNPSDVIVTYAALCGITMLTLFIAVSCIEVVWLIQEMLGNRTEGWWRKLTNQPPAQQPPETKDDR